MTPAERTLQARLAAHALHGRITDPAAHTAPATAAFEASFYRDIPEDLPPKIRDRMAAHKRKEHYARLSLAGVRARQAKAS